ncbi:MAG: bifunctional folylpolyglutamate synthase/dihydrofolate synthase [Hyphomonadaceae bacterium]|nr:bifunctional folylpolyglutamate synthase/dihydrofolate synthase [Hyphomonadaceae bacterium]
MNGDPVLERFQALFGPEFGHGKVFDIDKLRDVLTAMGAPHKNLPPVIHVAGTNGKGSTIAFMRAIAEAAGLRVHAFTKPHLFRLNERFVIASETATNESLIAAAERVADISRDITQFDAQVAVALLLFSQTAADITLIETGMGGRDDSTNVIEAPEISVITPISLDHQDVLGATLAEIATHKAGILKAGAPAIIARQQQDTMRVLEARADDIGAQLLRCGVEWDAYASHGRLLVQTEARALDLPLPGLHGRHQIDNAGLACATLLALGSPQFDDAAFADGVAHAWWPARLQPLTRGGLSAPIRAVGGEVWVDGGHNAHAAAALRHWAVSATRQRKASLVIIFAARPRKNWSMALKYLAMIAERVIAVPMPEGVDPQKIADYARSEGSAASVAPSLTVAMQNAAQLPAPRVLICGSFTLAAEALALEGLAQATSSD